MLTSLVPPLLWRAGRDLKRRLGLPVDHLAVAPDGWTTRLPRNANDAASWARFVARERDACEAMKAQAARADSRILADADERVKHLTFGYALALASRDRHAVSVLDYGGNLGDYYWLGKTLAPGIELDYHCKELPQLAEIGRQINPDVQWHVDDTCLAQPHDLVMFASSLQCLPDWRDTLRRAAAGTRRYLLLSDVATVAGRPYVVLVQSGGTAYLHAALNGAEIVKTAVEAGLRLVREFDMGAHPAIAGAAEQPTCVGWLFERDRP